MGIPYSRQINAAFDQVTPLVASGFEVLETTKNIAWLLFIIQVLTVILLSLILVVLLGIGITVNPDLEKERKALVTPTLQWLARRVQKGFRSRLWWLLVLVALVAVAVYAHLMHLRRPWEEDEEDEVVEGGEIADAEGEDVDAIKEGRSDQ